MSGRQQRARPLTRLQAASTASTPAAAHAAAILAEPAAVQRPHTRLQAGRRAQPACDALHAAAASPTGTLPAAQTAPRPHRPVTRLQAAAAAAQERSTAASVDLFSSSQPQQQQLLPRTRLQAARAAAKRPRAARDDALQGSTAQSQQQQQQQQQQQHDEEQPAAKKQRRDSVRLAAFAVLETPDHPQAVEQLFPLLEAMVSAPDKSSRQKKYTDAVYKVADQQPVLLLRAVLQRQHLLQYLLQALQSCHRYMAFFAALSLWAMLKAATNGDVGAADAAGAAAPPPANAAGGLVQAAAAAEAALAIQAAAPAAAPVPAQAAGQAAQALFSPLLHALCAQEGRGVLLILQAMHSARNPSVSSLMGSSMSMLTQAAQLAGPATVAVLLDALLAQQQQGLNLILQALSSNYASCAAAVVLRILASAAPNRVLTALLSVQQRRGLQLLLRALDGKGGPEGSDPTVASTRTALYALAQEAEGQQLQQLVKVLLRALQQGSHGAAQLVLSITQLPAGPVQLQPHVKLLLQLVPRRGASQILVAASLWTVVHNNEAAAQALTQMDPTPLLQTMQQDGDPATLAAGTVCLLSLSEQGQQRLVSRVADILAAVKQQHNGLVASMALRTIGLMSGGQPDAQQAVLQHVSDVLAVMLLQQHPDAAATAGSIVLTLLQSAPGMEVVSKEQNIDKLLQVVVKRGPALTHAVRAIAHIAGAVPDSRALIAAPQRQAVIHGLQDVVEELLLADIEFIAAPSQAYAALAPAYWGTVAAAACQFVPGYLRQLVQAVLKPELAMPAFEAVTYVSSFKAGMVALAPYIKQVNQAMTAPCFAGDEALQRYLRNLVIGVVSALHELRTAQQLAEVRMHHAGLQLAAAHARYRRRPRTKKLQAGVMLWLQAMGDMAAKNEQLKQQLRAVDAVLPA